jgi:PAS domain S-box-containing protein
LLRSTPQGHITLVNRKGCQILGYREDELIGQDWFTTCLPRRVDIEQVRTVFKKSLAGDQAGSEYYENPVRTRSGEERLIAWHNSTIRDTDGHIIGGLSAGEDITDRRQKEGELKQREQYQRALLDNFPFAVWLKDPESRFLTVNQGFVTLFGQRSADDVVGKNDFDIAPANLAEGYRADDRAVLASGKKKNVEEVIVDAEGTRNGGLKPTRRRFLTMPGGGGQCRICSRHHRASCWRTGHGGHVESARHIARLAATGHRYCADLRVLERPGRPLPGLQSGFCTRCRQERAIRTCSAGTTTPWAGLRKQTSIAADDPSCHANRPASLELRRTADHAGWQNPLAAHLQSALARRDRPGHRLTRSL